ncbi:MAG TPA: PhnD/SsuA/transferrin family substrate-binding protein [Thermodesulfovibrionales bacterium]|nr:PhnD/SsuA/transferrin family substrate-binding protein [Thermodesulfovibrionales bacterium]
MRYSRVVCLFCVCLAVSIFVAPVSAPAEHKGEMFRLGYSAKSITEVDLNDAAAALEIWLKEMAKDVGVSAESLIYTDIKTMLRDFRNGKLDMAITGTLDYLKAERELHADLAFVKVKSGKKTTKKVLLVNSDSPYSDIRNLRNKNLAIMKGDEIGDVFLNSILSKKNLPSSEKFFMNIREKNKPSNVILSVFFNQADACITTDASLKTMIELNPQIGKKLRVIESSPELIETVSFFRRDFDDATKQKVLKQIRMLNEHPRGQQVLLLFQVDRLVPIQKSDLDVTKTFFGNIKSLLAEK